jgi:hypothetical protein
MFPIHTLSILYGGGSLWLWALGLTFGLKGVIRNYSIEQSYRLYHITMLELYVNATHVWGYC